MNKLITVHTLFIRWSRDWSHDVTSSYTELGQKQTVLKSPFPMLLIFNGLSDVEGHDNLC